MRGDLVLMIVQKTKSAELLRPVQHFLFHHPEISDRQYKVTYGCIVQNTKH
jgi:hypothetical protein